MNAGDDNVDRNQLAEKLRRRQAYRHAVEVLTGAATPSVEQQLEILVAACGVLQGAPIISDVTKDHLAIVLAVSECKHARPGALRARLNYFAATFSCADFEEFRHRQAAYTNRSGVPPPSNPEVGSPQKSFVAEIAAVCAFIAIIVVGGVFLLIVSNENGQATANVAAQPADSLYKPVLPATSSKGNRSPIDAYPVIVNAPTWDWKNDPVVDDQGGKSKQPSILDDIGIPVLERPVTGETRILRSAPCIAPFEIKASSESNALVKLRDRVTSEDVMTIFVRRGETAKIEVPLGTYTVRFTTGEYWLGYEHRFGPTNCWEAREIFDFQQLDNRVSGYSITLYEVRDGNMQKRSINPKNF